MGWDASDEVARAASTIEEASGGEAITEREFDRMVTRLQLPAIAYRELILELEDRGVQVVPEEDSLAAHDDELAARRRAAARSSRGHGGFGHFLRVAGDHAILTSEQERDLGKRVLNGERAREILEERRGQLSRQQVHVLEERWADAQTARNELVKHNIRLVVHIAKRYFPQIRKLSLEFEDIVQEGVLGLNRAAEKFDPTKGFKFSTYATWWIRQAISRGIAERGYLIRLPVHVHDSLAKIRSYIWKKESRREPIEVEELAKVLGASVERTEDLLVLATGGGVAAVRSLDLPIGEDDSGTLGDLIEDDFAASTEELALQGIGGQDLERMLEDKLSERERTVVELRFGFHDGREHTLEEIGQRMGLTRERIRQIQKIAVEKLQQPKVLQLLGAA